MANLTTYGANALLNGVAIPATLYVKLHLGNPGPDALLLPATETTRKSFTRTTATVGVATNAALLEWLSYSTTEDLTHITIWDAVTVGNPWFVDAIDGGIAAAVAGQAVEISVNVLSLTMPIWS